MKSVELRGDVGLLLLLDVVELGLKGGQMVSAQLLLALVNVVVSFENVCTCISFSFI